MRNEKQIVCRCSRDLYGYLDFISKKYEGTKSHMIRNILNAFVMDWRVNSGDLEKEINEDGEVFYYRA